MNSSKGTRGFFTWLTFVSVSSFFARKNFTSVLFFFPLFKLVDSPLVKFLARNAVRLWNDSKSLLVLFERRTVWYYSYPLYFAPVHLTQTGLLVKLTAINYQQFCHRLVALYSSFAYFLVFPSASIRILGSFVQFSIKI